MEQAIYGDLYFVVNFTMDALALYLTAKLLHLPTKLWRTALGGALGALYSVISLTLPDGNFLSTMTALLVPSLLCLIAFGWQSVRSLVRQLAAFWAISLLLGGAMTAVCYAVGVWGSKQVSVGGEVQPLMGDLPFWGLIFIALLAGALLSLLLKRRKPTAQTVELAIEEASTVHLRALTDSGNLLTEPISGLPVIVVDGASVAALLPSELAFLASDSPQIPSLPTPRLRLIPCTTASGERILYGFIPRRVLVAGIPKEACIAVGKLPSGVEYNAIVPMNLL